jgi:hypothetical protein
LLFEAVMSHLADWINLLLALLHLAHVLLQRLLRELHGLPGDLVVSSPNVPLLFPSAS